MKLIVGLGNPGKKFEKTRHNVGFLVIDKLKKQIINKLQLTKFKFKKKFNAEILNLRSYDLDLVLAKPQTFMNTSGLAAARLRQFYKIKPKDIYIIHDDLDINLGEYKISFAKGPKQHKGVQSVENYLKSKQFWRVRIGVENRISGYQDIRISGEEYVLQEFDKKEKEVIDRVIDKIIKKLEIKIL